MQIVLRIRIALKDESLNAAAEWGDETKARDNQENGTTCKRKKQEHNHRFKYRQIFKTLIIKPKAPVNGEEEPGKPKHKMKSKTSTLQHGTVYQHLDKKRDSFCLWCVGVNIHNYIDKIPVNLNN